ncbi:MAG TPA: LysE family translocator [Acetobacteraceae bacterium]|nr:LysE family translocator [Acetobacteraceae bacterium]
MPDLHLLPAFVLATSVLMLIPGPNVALIVANSLAYGARWGVLTVLATSSAGMLQLGLVALGMASLVQELGGWFEWIRWAGVAYLLVLGIQQWRAPPPDLERIRPQPRSLGRIFGRAVAVSLTNPKTLLFYGAFFPQFLSHDAPPGPQLVVLAILYLLIAMTIDTGWALTAARVRGALGARVRFQNRASGAVLIGAGIGLALERAK